MEPFITLDKSKLEKEHICCAISAKKRDLPLTIVKLDTMEQAQSAPTPATIFSLFYNGKFNTTDLSVCMDSRFDKVMEKR